MNEEVDIEEDEITRLFEDLLNKAVDVMKRYEYFGYLSWEIPQDRDGRFAGCIHGPILDIHLYYSGGRSCAHSACGCLATCGAGVYAGALAGQKRLNNGCVRSYRYSNHAIYRYFGVSNKASSLTRKIEKLLYIICFCTSYRRL